MSNPGPNVQSATNTQPVTTGTFPVRLSDTFAVTKRVRSIAFLGDSNTDNGFFPPNGSIRPAVVSGAKFYTDVLPFGWAQALEGLDFESRGIRFHAS